LAVISIVSSAASAQVWPETRVWDQTAEADYQSWVNRSWTKNFLAQPGWYQNVKMDCADAVYAMRMIFAAENGLPFTMTDPTGSGRTISNRMTRWDNLAAGPRKRAFLLYIFGLGSTASLPADSYPVAVNRSAITSGTFLLTDRASHHSWTVKSISRTGIPMLLFASRPARTVFFERFEYPSMGFTFPNGVRPETNAGFRGFRQEQDLHKPVWEVAGFSLEQYQIPARSWRAEMQRRLAVQTETHGEKIHRLLVSACRGAEERITAVNEALAALRKLPANGCFGASQYDDLSTPSRDRRLRDSFEEFSQAVQDWTKAGRPALDPKDQAMMDSVLLGDSPQDLSRAYCPIAIGSGRTLALGQIFAAALGQRLSSNPHDPLLVRWGQTAGPSPRARACPVY
jgi:hypothetical protein